MRKIIQATLTAFLFLSGTCTYAQDWAAGFRLGDPTGISVKRYDGNKAFELSFGRPYHLGGYNYNYYYTHDNRFKNKFFAPAGYRNAGSFAVQVHYLIHKDLDKLFDGLKWYYGFGGQLRMKSFYLRYWDGMYYQEDRFTDLDIGPDAVIGTEYTFADIPLSIFLDVTLFLEVIDNFRALGQGGFGVRYNF